jgi:hypothetical protein
MVFSTFLPLQPTWWKRCECRVLRPLAAAPAVEWHEGATGLDLGASQGVDAEMMLRQGLQVLAVEGGAGWRMVFINPWLIIYENNGLLMINNLDNNG